MSYQVEMAEKSQKYLREVEGRDIKISEILSWPYYLQVWNFWMASQHYDGYLGIYSNMRWLIKYRWPSFRRYREAAWPNGLRRDRLAATADLQAVAPGDLDRSAGVATSPAGSGKGSASRRLIYKRTSQGIRRRNVPGCARNAAYLATFAAGRQNTTAFRTV